jgi:sodium/potassium-transporting ATPase subunit alpha
VTQFISANILSLLTIKGAPDVLIDRCSKYTSIEGTTKELDATTRATIEEIKNIWSSQGKRVILLARKIVPKENIFVDPSSSRFEDEVMRLARTDLTLVGIVGIVDPPRDEIPYVVSTLRGAGIRIFMVRLIKFYLRYYADTHRLREISVSRLKQSPPSVVSSRIRQTW